MMQRFRILSIMAALFGSLLVVAAGAAAAAPSATIAKNADRMELVSRSGLAATAPSASGPGVSFQGTFPISVTAGDYDLTYLVLDFAPGAEIPLHYHGGPALVVGMEGMLTLRSEAGSEHMVMAGDVMNEPAGARHVMSNKSNTAARVMAVVLLPKGAQLTTVVDTTSKAAGPTVPFQGDYPLTVAAGDYSLVNLLLDFAPGAEIPLHYHGGPAVVVGFEGTLTLRPEGGAEHMLTPGAVMNEKAGARHVMINTTNVDTKVLAGILLPKGAEVTTLVAQAPPPPGMPSTGSGDVAGFAYLFMLLALLAIALGAVTLYRSRRKA